MPRTRVLLTGFEPFGGEAENPSEQIARALEGRVIEGRTVRSAVLPCVFGTATDALRRELRRVDPCLVVCLGQAAGRASLGIERVAINVEDASIPDNRGAQPVDRPVVLRGPAAYWSTLPIKAIVAELRRQGLPADVSQTAGTFVCNHVFYALMHTLRARRSVRGGFVHVPLLPEQAARAHERPPSMPLEAMVRGVEVLIATALQTRRDVRLGGGATH